MSEFDLLGGAQNDITSYSDSLYNKVNETINSIPCYDLYGDPTPCPQIDVTKFCSGSGFELPKTPNLNDVVPDVKFETTWENKDLNFSSLINFSFQPLATFFIALGLFVLFFLITTFYYFFIYSNLYNVYKIGWNGVYKYMTISRFWLFVVVFVALSCTIELFIYFFLLQGSQINISLKITFITTLFVVGTTFLMTSNTTFVKIFENTLGYFALTLIWGKTIESKLKELFTYKCGENQLSDTNMSYLFIMSLLQHNNFDETIKMFKNGNLGFITKDNNNGNIKDDGKDDVKKYLFDCVTFKNVVGHMTWVYFSALTTTLICIKFLSKNR